MRLVWWGLAGLVVWPVAAHAVIVRGKVTTELGVPVAGARIQLIAGRRSVADTISGADGGYEIRTSFAGRFVLLTAPPALATGLAPQVGTPFYGSRSSLITLDIALNDAEISPKLSAGQTLVALPERQLATPQRSIPADQLTDFATPVERLAEMQDAVVVEDGQMGAPASLLLRGAPPQTLLVTVDAVTANDLGGSFPLQAVSTTGLDAIDPRTAIEVTPGANPLWLTGAEGGVVNVTQGSATNLRPTLTYTGDAGTLGALRNEAVATAVRGRLDVLGGFSRFDISGTTPAEPFHLTTWTGSAGYHVSAGTSLLVTARYDAAVAALPSPFEFFRVDPKGKVANQDLFGAATFETRTADNWHNVLRFGLARRRAETLNFATPAMGLPVTIRGANGYEASGTAAFNALPPREDRVTDRNEATYQTDYGWKPWLGVLAEVRYQDERAADVPPAGKTYLERDRITIAGGLHGEIRHRLFYQASGFFDYQPLQGATGAPRLGLTYAPVRPGTRRFRGTVLHVTLAAGTREPSLVEEAAVAKPETPRSRTLDTTLDQNILGPKVALRVSYFHSQFSHEFEPVGLGLLASQPVLRQTLALRTQGFEAAVRYQALQRVLFEGGYSYLAAFTERSAEPAVSNALFPGVRIGGLSALTGQRPFDRPPQSGFFRAEYSGQRMNASLTGTLVAKSDDTTGLLQTPGLLLPNRNLSPGYGLLDAALTAVVTRHVTVFTRLTNLTDTRQAAPLGYVSTPFLLRAGLRIRVGGE